MDSILEPQRHVPIVADVDLLVCGGGFAGVAGAVCAARNSAKVLLIEKLGFFGGMCTAALVITTPPLDNGINSEISGRLKERGVYAPCNNSGEETASLSFHAIEPEVIKYEFMRMEN